MYSSLKHVATFIKLIKFSIKLCSSYVEEIGILTRKASLYHIVGGGVEGALVHRVRHKEEVVPKQNVAVNIKKTLNSKEANLLGTPLSTAVTLGRLEGFPFILRK